MITEADFRALAASVDRVSDRPGGAGPLGALGFLSAAATAAAAGEVVSGTVIGCAARNRGSLTAITTSLDSSDDWVAVNETVAYQQHGIASMTHLDALGHFFFDGAAFGGAPVDIVGPNGVARLDIVPAASGIVGRGVLLDLPSVVGDTYLHLDRDVSLDEIHAWLQRTGVTVRAGDILFVRTGAPLAPEASPGGLPAVGSLELGCAPWIFDQRVSLIVSDGGLDTTRPTVEHVLTPWHILTLTRMGVMLVDVADLEALAVACAAAGRWTFLAAIGALPLAGATASPVNPLAIL